MYDRNPVRMTLLHMLPRFMGERGLPTEPFLTRVGIHPIGDGWPTGIVSRAQICALLQDVAQRAGEPTLGLQLAEAADPMGLALTGAALLAGATLRDCLRGHARMMPSLQAGVDITLEIDGTRAHWRHRLADSDPEHARVLNEGVAAFMVAAIRAILGERVACHVALPHRARAAPRIYEDRMQAGASFLAEHGCCVVSFDAALLDRPNRLGQAAVAPRPPPSGDGDAARLLPEDVLLSDEDLLRSLDLMMEGMCLSGTLSLVVASRHLGYSLRTLQRRLARCGTSFEALTDSWRRRRAGTYLADAALSAGAISRALGYNDPSHFVRAFRRWEGMTPLEYRRADLRRR